jgi:hypothetical protein
VNNAGIYQSLEDITEDESTCSSTPTLHVRFAPKATVADQIASKG